MSFSEWCFGRLFKLALLLWSDSSRVSFEHTLLLGDILTILFMARGTDSGELGT